MTTIDAHRVTDPMARALLEHCAEESFDFIDHSGPFRWFGKEGRRQRDAYTRHLAAERVRKIVMAHLGYAVRATETQE